MTTKIKTRVTTIITTTDEDEIEVELGGKWVILTWCEDALRLTAADAKALADVLIRTAAGLEARVEA